MPLEGQEAERCLICLPHRVHPSLFPFPYYSRTHKATNNQKEKKKKLHEQHFQQQCRECHQQRRQQEEDPSCKFEPVQSGTCKSRFAFRPEALPFLFTQLKGLGFLSELKRKRKVLGNLEGEGGAQQGHDGMGQEVRITPW